MKIAVVQMNIHFGEPEKNFKQVEKYIEDAAHNNADIVVFPELWNTGFALEKLETLADKSGEQTKSLLRQLSKKHGINIVGGSVATQKDDGYYNTLYITNRSGELVQEYDKVHLFPLMDEPDYFKPGNSINTFQIDGITMGSIICFDTRFPELTRKLVLDGAKIIFVPAQWPTGRVDHWEILLQARAIENQCFVIGVNRIGNDPNNEFNGHSIVVAPWGDLLLHGEEKEGIFYVDLSLEEVDRVRNTIPIFSARRIDLY